MARLKEVMFTKPVAMIESRENKGSVRKMRVLAIYRIVRVLLKRLVRPA